MFPAHTVRIKEEIPDENPSEISQSPAFNPVQEIREMKTEFVAVKEEIDPTDQSTTAPPNVTVNIKREPDNDTWAASNYNNMLNIKQEPVETINIVIEPVVAECRNSLPYNIPAKIETEPNAGITRDYYQFASTNRPQRSTTAKVQCQICKNRFQSLWQLESHIRSHNHEDSIYKCNKCNRTFKNALTFKAHEARGGCKPKPPLICQDCGLEFTKKFIYQSHIKIHSEIRPYHCDFCPMAFRHRRTIINHLISHTNDCTYACPVCKEVFTSQASVKFHLKVHTGERPYPCPICQKTFSFKHNALKHLLIHCREKVLTCSICQKVFPKESRLRYHMNTHMKLKPFFCDICRRAFSHKSNVIRHIIRKHPGLIKDGLYQPFK